MIAPKFREAICVGMRCRWHITADGPLRNIDRCTYRHAIGHELADKAGDKLAELEVCPNPEMALSPEGRAV